MHENPYKDDAIALRIALALCAALALQGLLSGAC